MKGHVESSLTYWSLKIIVSSLCFLYKVLCALTVTRKLSNSHL